MVYDQKSWIEPWDDISERILRDLATFGRTNIKKNVVENKYPNGGFLREFGKRCRPLFDEDVIDYATTRYGKRDDKLIITVSPNSMIIPKISKNKVRFHFRKIKIL